MKLAVVGYDTVREEYPTSLVGVDAIIVSGSPNSAYQDLQWIKVLTKYIANVYKAHPEIKLYGSCFGHQIICQALLPSQGAHVEKNPAGWELGVHQINLLADFASTFSSVVPASRSLRLQFLHGDHVHIPDGALPKGFMLVGSTPACSNQGVYQPGRVLTLQGHPEFDRFINMECLKLVAKRVGWDDEFAASAIASADFDDDANAAADLIMTFFAQDSSC